MKFVDEIMIRVRGGHGGAGSVHFLREKYREHGGPDGGDGGDGGSVYIEAHPSTMTLGHFMRAQLFKSESGEAGKGKNQKGADGADVTLRVPLGTEVIDDETGEKLGDMDKPHKRLLVAAGGKGGLGNQHFATSVNQAPSYAQPGIAGEERSLKLNLKLLADAGLIGLPNAGKSTILSTVSRNHPKIADYAFTTLTPNIGVVEGDHYRRLLLADIPGIIEGAHRGAGLGLSFLRHIERVQLIIYVIDVTSLNPQNDLMMLKEELGTYSGELLKRPALLVINKLDQAEYDEEFARSVSANLVQESNWKDSPHGPPEVLFISALEKKGIDELVRRLFDFFPDRTMAEKTLPE